MHYRTTKDYIFEPFGSPVTRELADDRRTAERLKQMMFNFQEEINMGVRRMRSLKARLAEAREKLNKLELEDKIEELKSKFPRKRRKVRR